MPLRRSGAILIVLACVFRAATVFAEPVTTIRASGSPFNRVDIVILGDGYTADDLSSGKYASAVETLLARVFEQEPYAEYQRFFNVSRIDVTSNQSGADHPSHGTYRDTALGATYECSGIERLICVDFGAVNRVLARSIDDPNARDIIILLVNDTEYGGWGGSLAVASTHPDSVEIALHELGHSFAFLVDEYGGPPPPSCSLFDPSEANATTETRRDFIKWKDWIDPTTAIPTMDVSAALPGLYEGARYCDRGMFRPTFNSKMRTLGVPFEQVNVEAHVKRIYNLVSPIDAVSPEPGVVQVHQGDTISFSVSAPSPLTHGMDVAWSVDGTRAGSGPVFGFAGSDFSPGPHTLTVTVADSTPLVRNDPAGVLRASETWSVEVLASGPRPFGGTPRPVPGTIQAEDFDDGGEGVAYHDTTTSNAGGEYRDTDVDIARTADSGGGYVVGWMPAGEWLKYTIAVSESRTYTLTARVAAPGEGGTFHVEFDGVNRTGPLTIPNTGGWQSWTDVTATVTLNEGVQGMRVVADSSSPAGVFGNLNYVRFDAADGSGPPRPFGGAPRPVPGTIEAEDFDDGAEGVAYHDTTTGNAGGEYRVTDVDIARTADSGGGYIVGWMPAGEWLKYAIAVSESRTYTLTARVAAAGMGGTFHVEFDGVNKTGPLTIPDTGGWQSWTDVTATVTLNAGVQRMRVVADSMSPTGVFGNFNYLRFDPSGGSGSRPFGGTPRAVPGTIEAEDFDEGGEGLAYHDTTTSNAGGEYRNTDVDIGRTTDRGDGYIVGWMPAGEWLNYTISVPESRTYTLTARVAAPGTGGTFHVEFNGVNKTGPLTIPDTGGWQSWADVTAAVPLNAGVQGMRVVADSMSSTGVFGNLNYIAITAATGAVPVDLVEQRAILP
jgi:IgA Peptidase M64/Carbohydrate binding module (family 6)